jgi:hypothetical protein
MAIAKKSTQPEMQQIILSRLKKSTIIHPLHLTKTLTTTLLQPLAIKTKLAGTTFYLATYLTTVKLFNRAITFLLAFATQVANGQNNHSQTLLGHVGTQKWNKDKYPDARYSMCNQQWLQKPLQTILDSYTMILTNSNGLLQSWLPISSGNINKTLPELPKTQVAASYTAGSAPVHRAHVVCNCPT